MPISSAILDALVKAGASAEIIVAYVKAEVSVDEVALEARRKLDRERKRLARQRGWRIPESEWLLLCAQVYRRDGEVCRYCGATEQLSVDHIQPVSRGGGHELENLGVACVPCNSSKSGHLLSEWQGRQS